MKKDEKKKKADPKKTPRPKPDEPIDDNQVGDVDLDLNNEIEKPNDDFDLANEGENGDLAMNEDMEGNSKVTNFIAQPDASLGPGMEDYFNKEKTEFEDQDESINLEVEATNMGNFGMQSIGHGSHDYPKINFAKEHGHAHEAGTNFAFGFHSLEEEK